MKHDSFCFWHSNQTEDKRNEAVLAGGKSLKRSYGNEKNIEIKNTEDILNLLTETINDLRQNKTSVKIANTLGYLSNVALKALEQGDLQRRLEVLEYALQIKK